MLMRHFGHGVGHLQYERHPEIGTELIPAGDDNHVNDDTSETEESEDEMNDDSEMADAASSEGESEEGESEEIEDSCSDCASEMSYASL